MKKLFGVLEFISWIYFILLLQSILGLIINMKIAVIIITILYVIAGIHLFRNDTLYDEIIKLLYGEKIFKIYDHLAGREKDSFERANKIAYFWFIIILIKDTLIDNYVRAEFNLNSLITLILGIINGIVGLILYRKYNKHGQYIISLALAIIILIFYIEYYYL